MKKVLNILILLMICSCAYAQDSQFTQFYAAPTYLNPAMVGTSVQSRVGMNYRNQWTAIPKAFVTYNFYADHFSPKLKSGFGLLATHDRAGTGGLRGSTIGLQYAYEIRINEETFFRPAVQFSYSNRNINFNDLTFGDQLIRGGAETTLEANTLEPINFFDFSTGAFIFSPTYWLGVSVHHLNEPNENLNANDISTLAKKLSVHGGWRTRLKGKFYSKSQASMVLAFNYKQQYDFNQLDLGGYLELAPMTVGLWYRGLPLKSNGYQYFNHDAISFLLGYHSGEYKIGYSYDITISQLSLGASAGSHEISIMYEWANKKNPRLARKRVIPCAKF